MPVNGTLLLLATTLSLALQAPASIHDRIAAHVKAHDAEFIAVRRDLHRHPELSGREARTAGIVAERLKSLGLDVRTGVGGHGVVGILTGGRPGPLVAYRADMDAVTSAAVDPAPFASDGSGCAAHLRSRRARRDRTRARVGAGERPAGVAGPGDVHLPAVRGTR